MSVTTCNVGENQATPAAEAEHQRRRAPTLTHGVAPLANTTMHDTTAAVRRSHSINEHSKWNTLFVYCLGTKSGPQLLEVHALAAYAGPGVSPGAPSEPPNASPHQFQVNCPQKRVPLVKESK